MDKSYCEKNNCPWLENTVCMGVSNKICSSPNPIHNGRCDFDNGILPDSKKSDCDENYVDNQKL